MDLTSATSLTLLARLREQPGDQRAWAEFECRYRPKVIAWCRRWGLQEADAQDVAQNVLLDLAGQMARFHYREGGRFRAWLRTVAHRAWCDFLERRQRPGGGTGDSAVQSLLESVAARDDFSAWIDAEAERELLDEAIRQVRPRVKATTWEAFRLLALEGLSGAEVAQRLGIESGTAFVSRCRVEKMLREAVERLDGAENPT